MKGWPFGLFMLLIGELGCRQDEASPNDLLYRTWRMTQIQYKTGEPVAVSPSNEWAIVTFKSNGMILYGHDGKYDPCCSPARFKRQGNLLDLVDVAAIPLPERTSNDLCARIDCASPGSAWQLIVLNPAHLIIKQDNATIAYQPYP